MLSLGYSASPWIQSSSDLPRPKDYKLWDAANIFNSILRTQAVELSLLETLGKLLPSPGAAADVAGGGKVKGRCSVKHRCLGYCYSLMLNDERESSQKHCVGM